MPTLQAATDIVALVFMGIVILAILTLIILAVVVRAKIRRARNNIQQKVDIFKNLPFIGKEIFSAIKKVI